MSKYFPEIQINTDGGSRGNPGPAGIGAIAKAGEETIFTVSQKIGINTNNVAEYQAVIAAFDEYTRLELSSDKLKFVLDSELVVKQITGLYKIKQPHLQELRIKIENQIKNLKTNQKIKLLTFTHVLRHLNKEADALVNSALDL